MAVSVLKVLMNDAMDTNSLLEAITKEGFHRR